MRMRLSRPPSLARLQAVEPPLRFCDDRLDHPFPTSARRSYDELSLIIFRVAELPPDGFGRRGSRTPDGPEGGGPFLDSYKAWSARIRREPASSPSLSSTIPEETVTSHSARIGSAASRSFRRREKCVASSNDDSGKTTANSSPPTRHVTSATRATSRTRSANVLRTPSPFSWPSSSLTRLNLSKSRRTSASRRRTPGCERGR